MLRYRFIQRSGFLILLEGLFRTSPIRKSLPEASRAGVESGLFQGACPQSLFQVCDLQKIFRTQPVIFKLLPLIAPEPL